MMLFSPRDMSQTDSAGNCGLFLLSPAGCVVTNRGRFVRVRVHLRVCVYFSGIICVSPAAYFLCAERQPLVVVPN